MADGKQVKGCQKTVNLKWKCGDVEFVLEALILPVCEYDLILDMLWFESLGQVTWNFTDRVIQFEVKGQKKQLKALPKPEVKWMTSEQLLSAISKAEEADGNQYFLVQLCSETVKAPNLVSSLQSEMQVILHEFSDVFAEPKGLPPSRGIDHRIHLRSNEPVNVKPYRYPKYYLLRVV